MPQQRADARIKGLGGLLAGEDEGQVGVGQVGGAYRLQVGEQRDPAALATQSVEQRAALFGTTDNSNSR
ncbi:hypothetical protein D9M69_652510 [compost metagenome]